MVAEAFWGNHGLRGSPVTRCGVLSLRCGVAHLNNKSADKARVDLVRRFWQIMVDNRAQVVFEDFNKRAYLNTNGQVDRENNTMKQCLILHMSNT